MELEEVTKQFKEWVVAIVKECGCYAETYVFKDGKKTTLISRCEACQRDIDRFELTEKDLK